MGKKVTVYTSAYNAETGESVNLEPGDEAPEWSTMGDHVFASQDVEDVVAAGPSQTGPPAKVEDESPAKKKNA